MPQFDKIMFISQLFWLTASSCLFIIKGSIIAIVSVIILTSAYSFSNYLLSSYYASGWEYVFKVFLTDNDILNDRLVNALGSVEYSTWLLLLWVLFLLHCVNLLCYFWILCAVNFALTFISFALGLTKVAAYFFIINLIIISFYLCIAQSFVQILKVFHPVLFHYMVKGLRLILFVCVIFVVAPNGIESFGLQLLGTVEAAGSPLASTSTSLVSTQETSVNANSNMPMVLQAPILNVPQMSGEHYISPLVTPCASPVSSECWDTPPRSIGSSPLVWSPSSFNSEVLMELSPTKTPPARVASPEVIPDLLPILPTASPRIFDSGSPDSVCLTEYLQNEIDYLHRSLQAPFNKFFASSGWKAYWPGGHYDEYLGEWGEVMSQNTQNILEAMPTFLDDKVYGHDVDQASIAQIRTALSNINSVVEPVPIGKWRLIGSVNRLWYYLQMWHQYSIHLDAQIAAADPNDLHVIVEYCDHSKEVKRVLASNLHIFKGMIERLQNNTSSFDRYNSDHQYILESHKQIWKDYNVNVSSYTKLSLSSSILNKTVKIV